MEYDGDLFRHYIRNSWYEVGTKFDDCGMKFDELGTYEIQSRSAQIQTLRAKIHPSAALRAAGGC